MGGGAHVATVSALPPQGHEDEEGEEEGCRDEEAEVEEGPAHFPVQLHLLCADNAIG